MIDYRNPASLEKHKIFLLKNFSVRRRRSSRGFSRDTGLLATTLSELLCNLVRVDTWYDKLYGIKR
jgi:hypothetical protein